MCSTQDIELNMAVRTVHINDVVILRTCSLLSSGVSLSGTPGQIDSCLYLPKIAFVEGFYCIMCNADSAGVASDRGKWLGEGPVRAKEHSCCWLVLRPNWGSTDTSGSGVWVTSTRGFRGVIRPYLVDGTIACKGMVTHKAR